MLNLDTHIVVDFFTGGLSPAEERLLARETWGISAIVIWEIYSLVRLGRILLDVDDPVFTRDLERFHIWPITPNVRRQLRKLDFQSDPADELIAATSLAHNVPLVTRDELIRGSRVVPFANA